MRKVRVKLKSRLDESYNILIGSGAADQLPGLIASTGQSGIIGLVIDENVAYYHGERIESLLNSTGRSWVKYIQPSGEEHKTRAAKERIEDFFFESGLGRSALIVAAGGGVTGDMAGFTAATFMRGIPVIQLPTTLLSQVDSSVGGKTGLDTPAGKNMVGAFHQPAGVIADPLFLKTLKEDEFLSGFGEILKHALLFDPSLYNLLLDKRDALLQRNPELLADVVATNCRLKAEVVRRDAKESEYRKTLNLGHTFAHALESVTSFRVKHGVAVLHGLCAEACIGAAAGLQNPESVDDAFRLVEAYLPPEQRWGDFDVDAVVRAMVFDKKNRDSSIFFSLLDRTGRPLSMNGKYAFAVAEPEIRQGVAAFRERFLS